MEKHVGWWVCQLAGSDVYCGGAVCDIRHNRNGLLDGWMVICELVICSGSDDVCSSLFQSILLQNDRANLPWPNDHRFDFHHDSDLQYGDLHSVVEMSKDYPHL